MRLLACTFGRASRTRKTPPSSEGNNFSLTERRYGYGWGDRQVLPDSHTTGTRAQPRSKPAEMSPIWSLTAWKNELHEDSGPSRTSGRTIFRTDALQNVRVRFVAQEAAILRSPVLSFLGSSRRSEVEGVQCHFSVLFGQSLTAPKADGALRKYSSPDVTTPLPPQKSLMAW